MEARSSSSAHETAPEAYARTHAPRFVAELAELVRYPSVSSEPHHAGDMRRCAVWLGCGAHQGPGVKAVIPARASAMLDFVSSPIRILERSSGCAAVSSLASSRRRSSWQCASRFSAPPVSTPRASIAVRAGVAAYRTGFGRTPVFLRIGGTIPVVHMLQRILRIPTVMMGFALPDSNLHAPDENLHLPTFFRGIRTSMHFLREMAERGAT